jgi:hypothetical protein
MAKINKQGKEVIDTTPVELPLNWKRPVSLSERIRSAARQEISRLADEKGYETFEEADDFDVDDDFDPRSPWEMDFDQEMEQGRDSKRGMNEEVPQAQKAPGNDVETKTPGNPGEKAQ